MRCARLAVILLVAPLALAAGACGGSGSAERAARSAPEVRIRISSPSDTLVTRDTTLTVRGSVEPPDASVQVLGRPADVIAGRFTAKVDLDPGANVIDLAATAPHRDPAMAAVRVTREMPVQVPDLSGLTAGEAGKRVRVLGLQLAVEAAGGLLERLLPGDPGVCEQHPSAGDDAMRGTTVRVLVAKRC
jgi:hypothetical protein